MDNDQMLNDLRTMTGMTGLFSIIVTLCAILLAWTVLQEAKLDVFFKHPRGPKARLFQVMAAVIMGHLLARFILDYWDWSRMLRGFVE